MRLSAGRLIEVGDKIHRNHRKKAIKQSDYVQIARDKAQMIHLREAALFLEVELFLGVCQRLVPDRQHPSTYGNVAQIGLDLGESNGESVLLEVTHVAVGRELEVVSVLNLDDVGQQVGNLDVEVLDNDIELVVGVLCSWDGNVSDLSSYSWDDDLSEVVDEVRLVLQVAITVKSKVLDELLDVNTELLVERVLVVSKEELLDRVEELLSVAAVSLVPELSARVAKVLSILVALILHDVAFLLDDSSSVRRGVVPPLSELGVVLSIGVETIDGIKDGLHRGVVGKSLEEDSELHLGILVGRVGSDSESLVGTLAGDVLCSALVLLSYVKEEVDGLVEVIMLLLLDKDLCKQKLEVSTGATGCDAKGKGHTLQSVDESILSLFRELVLQVVDSLVLLLLSGTSDLVLSVIWNSVAEDVLDAVLDVASLITGNLLLLLGIVGVNVTLSPLLRSVGLVLSLGFSILLDLLLLGLCLVDSVTDTGVGCRLVRSSLCECESA